MGKDVAPRQQQAGPTDPGQQANALFGPMGAPGGSLQGGVGATVGMQNGPADGMDRAANGGMEPDLMTDMMHALFGGDLAAGARPHPFDSGAPMKAPTPPGIGDPRRGVPQQRVTQ